MSTHETYYWTAGDDWQFNVTLLKNDGDPFDLAGAPDIRWSLVGENGLTALTEADINIVVIDPVAGLCAIQVPADKTTALATGRYTDMIRIVDAGMASTLSHGLNWITADPWVA